MLEKQRSREIQTPVRRCQGDHRRRKREVSQCSAPFQFDGQARKFVGLERGTIAFRGKNRQSRRLAEVWPVSFKNLQIGGCRKWILLAQYLRSSPGRRYLSITSKLNVGLAEVAVSLRAFALEQFAFVAPYFAQWHSLSPRIFHDTSS